MENPFFEARTSSRDNIRNASIGEELRKMCEERQFGLILHEIDILNGGKSHDLTAEEAQGRWESRIKEGEFDIAIIAPLCSSWTRLLFSDKPGPQPCRDKFHPWFSALQSTATSQGRAREQVCPLHVQVGEGSVGSKDNARHLNQASH